MAGLSLQNIGFLGLIGTGAAGLYPFSSFTFTNASATGPTGPTLSQCLSAYSGQNFLPSFFEVNNGYQTLTVPETGTYLITAAGASGGNPGNAPSGTAVGAIVSGRVSLQQGDKLTFVVGQRGGNSNTTNNNPGGGGGTFITKGSYSSVVSDTDILLLAAGGGGGGSITTQNNNYNDGIGQVTQESISTSNSTAPAVGNGAPASGNSNSTGGAGYLTGTGLITTKNFGGAISEVNSYGFRQGALGSGSGDYFGGFGGGGMGSAQQSADQDKGGGGGYTGGPYAFDANSYGAGGGSFIGATLTNISTSIGTAPVGHGYFSIQLL